MSCSCTCVTSVAPSWDLFSEMYARGSTLFCFFMLLLAFCIFLAEVHGMTESSARQGGQEGERERWGEGGERSWGGERERERERERGVKQQQWNRHIIYIYRTMSGVAVSLKMLEYLIVSMSECLAVRVLGCYITWLLEHFVISGGLLE